MLFIIVALLAWLTVFLIAQAMTRLPALAARGASITVALRARPALCCPIYLHEEGLLGQGGGRG